VEHASAGLRIWICQTFDVHNKTFEPAEVACFKTHTQGLSLHRLL